MRVHLFEFGDLSWFPRPLHNAMTSYLAVTYGLIPAPAHWAKIIAESLDEQGIDNIVDLCSGAGGPIPILQRELAQLGHSNTRINQTDLHAREGVEPLDALSFPHSLTGLRTMFAAFHHFQPPQAKTILRQAAESGQPICIFEATSRTPLAIVSTLFIPLFVLLLTPRVRPLTFTQLLFTYLIPILPFVIAWDGFVSNCRTYTSAEMLAMTREINADSYRWQALDLTIPGVPFPLPALIGRPQKKSAAA